MDKQSGGARIRAQIDQEIAAMELAKHGFATVARHEIITHRFANLDKCVASLAEQIGDQAAIETLIEQLEEKSGMSQEQYQQLALEIAMPEIYQEWQRRAETSQAWADFFLLCNAFAEALRRAPLTRNACEEVDIKQHLDTELACLSDVLLLLFPDGVMSAKVYADEA